MTSIVQTKIGIWYIGTTTSYDESFTSALTTGTKLYAMLWGGDTFEITTAGWTRLEHVQGGTEGGYISLWEADPSAGSTVSVADSGGSLTAKSVTLWEAIGSTDVSGTSQGNQGSSGTFTGPTLTPTIDNGIMLFGVHAGNQSYVAVGVFTAVAPLTADAAASKYSRVHKWTARRTTALAAVTPTATYTGMSSSYTYATIAVVIAVSGPFAPVADFTSDTSSILEGASVAFTDTSTQTPTSWAWDFGDGGTSTSQNPTHVYAAAGSYTVSLTATNATGSDTETKVAYISVSVDVDFVDPPPADALLEIYAAEPGSARWGIAHWGEDVWSQAGWQDVTPQGVRVAISWGSSRPELGILSVQEAASWAVDYYDPDRILDPANADSPYFGNLIPYLPIRLSHRGTVVRVGYATGISHDYETDFGYMRGADQITRLANADVPSDSTLPDTLYARAVAAISAAGLAVEVATVIGTDPPVSPWLTGTRSWSVWEWVKDAAQEVLHIPYIDRYGVLSFRPWASPLIRGRSVDSPELIGLQVVTDYSGNYSVVQAREDDVTLIERALTPPPRYGARTYTRDEITIDPGDWADAVLADRSLSSLLWKPGDIRPETALRTEDIATLEAVELITLSYPETDPDVEVTGVIVGGEINVRSLRPEEAFWRFRLELATAATLPLTLDGGGPTDYLTTEAADEFLYPDV